MENNETRYSHSLVSIYRLLLTLCVSVRSVRLCISCTEYSMHTCQIYESSMDAQSNESDASIVIFSIASRSYMLHTHSYLLQQNQRTKCPIVRDVFSSVQQTGFEQTTAIFCCSCNLDTGQPSTSCLDNKFACSIDRLFSFSFFSTLLSNLLFEFSILRNFWSLKEI